MEHDEKVKIAAVYKKVEELWRNALTVAIYLGDMKKELESILGNSYPSHANVPEIHPRYRKPESEELRMNDYYPNWKKHAIEILRTGDMTAREIFDKMSELVPSKKEYERNGNGTHYLLRAGFTMRMLKLAEKGEVKITNPQDRRRGGPKMIYTLGDKYINHG